MPFSKLGLSDKVQAAVAAAGYTSPTPIQEQAIPHVVAGRDVLGIAQTGTGKTAAFTLPMITRLESGRARARMPRTLILEPTRELAAQVEESFAKYGAKHKLTVALLIGGVSFDEQDAKLTRGVDVLIATPGRLLDHFERGRLLLTGIEILVIDEADRMLDMGFIPDIERICKLVPFTRQTLFFSATMPPEIARLTNTFLSNPARVEVSKPASMASNITQLLVPTGADPKQKREVLRRLIRDAENLQNGIIFCNRKSEVANLHRSLVKHGFSAVALHGDMDQHSRLKALDSFRNGEMTLLVASDVAARGLDIPEVSHIFNFDVPHHPEDYVHRIGRTGRAGRAGASFTLASPADKKSLAAIEKLIGQSIPWASKPQAEAPLDDTSASDRPSRARTRDGGKGRQRRGGRGREKSHGTPESAKPAESRPARPQASPAEASGEPSSHLPAFLLRPVRQRVS
jgi:superfamily II DNA/RNA helicase